MVADRIVKETTVKKVSVDSSAMEKIYAMILKRNNFYRKNLRYLILVMLLGIVTLIFLLIAIYNLSIEQKTVYYIPANLNGIVIKSERLTAPDLDGVIITDQQVIDWAQLAIPVVYNFNFLSSEANFRNMISLFTPEGYRAYKYALEEESKTIATIQENKSSVQGSGCGFKTVKLLKAGVESVQNFPVYVWHLEMPMVVRNASVDLSSVYIGTLRMSIQRVPQLISKSGLAIYNFVYYDTTKYDGDAEFAYLCEKLLQA